LNNGYNTYIQVFLNAPDGPRDSDKPRSGLTFLDRASNAFLEKIAAHGG